VLLSAATQLVTTQWGPVWGPYQAGCQPRPGRRCRPGARTLAETKVGADSEVAAAASRSLPVQAHARAFKGHLELESNLNRA
jgi:hypothetical protein